MDIVIKPTGGFMEEKQNELSEIIKKLKNTAERIKPSGSANPLKVAG